MDEAYHVMADALIDAVIHGYGCDAEHETAAEQEVCDVSAAMAVVAISRMRRHVEPESAIKFVSALSLMTVAKCSMAMEGVTPQELIAEVGATMLQGVRDGSH